MPETPKLPRSRPSKPDANPERVARAVFAAAGKPDLSSSVPRRRRPKAASAG